MSKSFWNSVPASWQHVGPPLKPSPEDIASLREIIQAQSPRRILLLGVTPEIASIKLSPGSHLFAVDKNPKMLELVWPGDTPQRTVSLAHWSELSFPDGYMDMVIGDGSLNAMPDSNTYPALLQEIRRVTSDQGNLVLRLFCLPDETETLQQIEDDLWAGRIQGYGAFRWRIAMAMQKNVRSGVIGPEIWKAFQQMIPDRDRLAEILQHPREAIDYIDNYRNSDAQFSFPTLAQTDDFMHGLFERKQLIRQTYELGERCPTVRFKAV